MRIFIFVLFISIFATSCYSTYFLSTLSSANEHVEQVENGDFLIENDDYWVAYSFNGENAPIMITVYNKSDEPICVNWSKSAMVLNNQSYGYSDNVSNIVEEINIHRSGDNTHVEIKKPMAIAKTTSFIPPESKVSHIPFELGDLNINPIVASQDYKDFSITDKNNVTVKVDRVDFTREDSPLKLKSYLTIYKIDETPKIIEQSFFLSNIMKSKSLKPHTLEGNIGSRGDFFYIEKPANTSAIRTVGGVVLLGGLVVLGVVLGGDEDGEYYNNSYY